MTLIVITTDYVYVDSYESNGNLKFNIGGSKVHQDSRLPGLFVAAGAVADMMIAIGNHADPTSLLASEYPCDSPDNTLVVWVYDSEVWILHCAKGARWHRQSRRAAINLQAGAGWPWFEAFYAEHGDIEAAFKLAADLHPECATPINTIEISSGKVRTCYSAPL